MYNFSFLEFNLYRIWGQDFYTRHRYAPEKIKIQPLHEWYPRTYLWQIK